jgi:hypothetical protein
MKSLATKGFQELIKNFLCELSWFYSTNGRGKHVIGRSVSTSDLQIMNDTQWTYYAGILLSRLKPSAVFRFSSDDNKLPERFSLNNGWVEDRDLWLMKMKGHITEADRINEKEAEEIIAEITL